MVNTEHKTDDALVTHGPGFQKYGLLDKFVQLCAVYIWVGWLCTLSVGMGGLAFVSRPARITGLSLLALATVMPIPRFQDSLGPMYSAFGNFLMRRAAEYFSLRVQMTTTTQKAFDTLRAEGTPVVIGLEPHGVIPFSIFFAHQVLAKGWLGDGRGLMSSTLFRIPGMRQAYRSVAAAGADKKTMYTLLDKGISCALIPGGIKEVPLLNKGSDKDLHIYLNQRLGFVKVALEKGAPVVPAFCFGILESYSWWIVPGKLAEKVGRTIGFMPMVYFGAMGIPLGIPRKVPLTVVVGEPIKGPTLPKVPTGCEVGALLTEEQQKKLSAEINDIVAATHAKYVKAMVSLFEDHKHRLNMGDMTLHVE